MRRNTISAALVLLLALAGIVAAGPAQATFATGGSGLYVGSIDWFEWGSDGEEIPSEGMTKSNTRTVEGKDLVTTCTLSGITDSLFAYRSGEWVGDAFDNLYNVGGADSSNTLVAGLVTADSSLVSFNFACTVTYDGAPLPMAGLVFADAESSTLAGGRDEYIEAKPTTAATWRIIDRARNGACATSSIATLDADGTLNLAPDGDECSDSGGYGPAAVAFMQGATAADVTMHGGGKTAVALGVVLQSDFGDAPASYGSAGAFYQSGWTGGTVPVGSTNVFDGFTLATTTPPGIRLGNAIDSEPAAQHGASATSDGVDEDAISAPGTLSNVLAGTAYTLSDVACTSGYARGWIDWNHNGVFDPAEASDTAACAGPTVDLNWSSIPSDVVSASSYLRLRAAGSSAEVANPTGMSLTGEVEDYPITIDAVEPVVANDDTDSTPQGVPVTVTPLANDTADADYPLTAASVRVLDPADSTYKTSVTIPGEGTYTAQADGTVTFAPVPEFTGTATPVDYRVSDALGRTATASITIDVVPGAPSAEDDTDTTAYETPVNVDVLDNDTPGDVSVPLVPSSVRLLDPADSTYKSTVTVPGEGVYETQEDGSVTFTPADGFRGSATPVGYRVSDTDGATSTATLTITVGTLPAAMATTDAASGTPGKPVTLTPLMNDAPSEGAEWDPSTLCLIPPTGATSKDVTVVEGTTCAKQVTVADVGTWVVDPDGTVTFTSVEGYLGTAEIDYLVTDTAGLSRTSTMSVSVAEALASTGMNAALVTGLAVLLLIAGTVLVLVGRRTREE